MRFLKYILIIGIPLLIVVNLYSFSTAQLTGGDFKYEGFQYVRDYFSTFNGLHNTMDVLANIQTHGQLLNMANTQIVDIETFFVAVGEFFTMIWYALVLPFSVMFDITWDIIWFIGFLGDWLF